jgi:hypothetical protein
MGIAARCCGGGTACELRSVVAAGLVLIMVSTAAAKYSGGSGTASAPYQIATAADLILLGDSPEDYGKHFILTDDIDLARNLPGRKVFYQAVIAAGSAFTGVFDGNGHTIANPTIQGGGEVGVFGSLGPGAQIRNVGAIHVNITASNNYAGGLVGRNSGATITACYATGKVAGTYYCGGFVGGNTGRITKCYSRTDVTAAHTAGGFVGHNGDGVIANCYSRGSVHGQTTVGGFVGDNDDTGSITNSYSTGEVTTEGEAKEVGGFAGNNTYCSIDWIDLIRYRWDCDDGQIAGCFWDGDAAGIVTSHGGTSKTTAEMKNIATFEAAKWDFDNIWQMRTSYPELRWQELPPQTIDDVNDLMGLASRPEDKHYILTCNIDLAGVSLEPIGNFTGVFDGDGYMISNLHIDRRDSDEVGMFRTLANGAIVKNLRLAGVEVRGKSRVGGIAGRSRSRALVKDCHVDGVVSGSGDLVGGIVGDSEGDIDNSKSGGTIAGENSVGGLAGRNAGNISDCYTCNWVEGNSSIGGIVGDNQYRVVCCYATGDVAGNTKRGGVAGSNSHTVLSCFWNSETSGQTTSAGGEAKSTLEMKDISTFVSKGWDFASETKNGAGDVWWIPDNNYPRLWWEYGAASSPGPANGATDVQPLVVVQWLGGAPGMEHDAYFGVDAEAVADATVDTTSIYVTRQPPGKTTLEMGPLEFGQTYYWRIDARDPAHADRVWKGPLWSFTMIDFVPVTVVDDFESYPHKWPSLLILTWTTVWMDGMGAFVGPYPESAVVHGGLQSMPMGYNNVGDASFSEVTRTWQTPQNWTVDGADTVTLYFRGDPNNASDRLYVAVEDSSGRTAVEVHPDMDAVQATEWQKWHIALANMRAGGVDVAAVQEMMIGVGDREHPTPGGAGRIYIDDICLTKRMP